MGDPNRPTSCAGRSVCAMFRISDKSFQSASSAPAGAIFKCFGDAGDSCYQRIKNATNKKNYSGN
jgi:hypothetical protein